MLKWMTFVHLLVIGLSVRNIQAQEGSECFTPDNRPGVCISIYDCQELIELLRTRSRDPRVINFLQGSACGFLGSNPLVCCPRRAQPIQTRPPPDIVVTPPTNEIKTPDLSQTTTTEKSSGGTAGRYVLPTGNDCGYNNASYYRIVGGRPALLGEFPWIVAIGYKSKNNPNNPRWLCGGSLITEKHVLTAAHCIKTELYLVRAGDLDLYSDDDGAQPIDIPVEKVIKHQKYIPPSTKNDIAILVLNRPAKGFLIAPICLPKKESLRSQSFERYYPFVAGWGSVAYNGPSSPSLQAVMLPIVSNTQCKQAYARIKAADIGDGSLCAGYLEGKKDSCQGDSGGPLMIAQRQGTDYSQFYQIGVVSFGIKCAEPGFPGVYTRVTEYLDWIEDNLIV